MDENMTIDKGRMYGNVLLGKTPTFSGWTADPAGDVDRLTDNSLNTATTSGSFTLGGAWQYAYIDFAVANGLYIMGGYGNLVCATASPYLYAFASGKQFDDQFIGDSIGMFRTAFLMVDDDRIRFGLTADGISTVTPNLFELWAIRVA